MDDLLLLPAPRTLTAADGACMLKPHQRTVNMLRFNLGSPTDGEFTAGSGTTNGTDMFP